MAEIKKVNVATPRAEVAAYRDRARVTKDLMGGLHVMRAAGVRYLPQYDGEDDAKWKDRVQGATLFNGYEKTLAYLAGQVFSRDVAMEKEDQAKGTELDALVENIDGEGNNLTTWAKRFFHGCLNDGFGLILVDSESVVTRPVSNGTREYLSKDDAGNEAWKPLTAEASAVLGLRPKLVRVLAENVLGWRYEVQEGKKRLTLLRILETYTEQGEWDAGDKTRLQVRVLRPGGYEIWRKQNEDKDEWVKEDEGALPGDEIPVAFYRPGKPLDEVTCAPALEALADKNVEHWQKQAEHNQLMTWVRSPGMYAAGAGPEDKVPWGPGTLTKISDPSGRIQPIGVDAPSVAASRQELEDLKTEMALFGLQLLMPRTGDVTATESALSSAESDSTLKGWALELKDALEQAMVFMGVFMGGQVQAPSLVVNTEFRPALMDDAVALQGLSDDVKSGIISRETYLKEKKRRGIFADDFDIGQENERIAKEQRAGTFQAAATSAFGGMDQPPAANPANQGQAA